MQQRTKTTQQTNAIYFEVQNTKSPKWVFPGVGRGKKKRTPPTPTILVRKLIKSFRSCIFTHPRAFFPISAKSLIRASFSPIFTMFFAKWPNAVDVAMPKTRDRRTYVHMLIDTYISPSVLAVRSKICPK